MAAAVATLFASCSKDATEDLTVVKSDAAFVASMTFDSAATTRHHINEAGHYEWEAGDMVGVSNGDITVPFVTKAGGELAAFEAAEDDIAYLGDGTYYMVYPYGVPVTAEEDEDDKLVVTGLKVPAAQRYRANSFATMTAPAFAVVEDFEQGQQVKFNAPASMFSFPIIGKGSIKSLTLTSTNYAIAGAIKAVIAVDKDGNEVVTYTTDPQNSTNEITLDFGAGSYELDYEEAVTNVVFVVASGKIGEKNETFTLTANWANKKSDDETFEIPANTVLEPNTLYEMQPRTFGLDGYYLINGENAELDFVTYAYFTQPGNADDLGTAGYPSVKDYETLAEELGYDELWGENGVASVKALLLKDINLGEFDAKAAHDSFTSIVNPTAKELVYINALKWYINNENAIESLSYNAIVGGRKAATVIDGVVVLGNGITAGAALENLKFTNSTVVATDNTANIGFVAPSFDTATVKNVTIGEGNVLNTTGGTSKYIGGIFGYAYSKDLPTVTVEALPMFMSTLENAEPQHLGQLYGFLAMNKNLVIDLEASKVAAFDVPVVYETYSDNVLDFTNAPADAAYANVVAKNVASIVINGTSYWNGKFVANDKDEYFTAEELTYALNTSAADNIVLTHNIDLQSTEIKNGVDHKAANINTISTTKAEDGTYNVFEIKNVKTAIYNASEVAALFGNANVSNIKLTNVAIDVPASAKKAAGVAVVGTVTNVTIDGLTINIPAASKLTVVGGVLAEADVDDIDNVNVKGLAINNAGEDVLKIRAGIMAGTLNIEPQPNKNADLKSFYASAATFTKVGEEQPNCSKGQLEYYTSKNNYGAALPFGTISVNNAGFAKNGNVKAYLNVAEGKFGSMTRLAAGIVFKSTLTNATTKVEYNEADIDKYNYVLISNAPIAKQKKIFGFYKKAE